MKDENFRLSEQPPLSPFNLILSYRQTLIPTIGMELASCVISAMLDSHNGMGIDAVSLILH